MTSIETLTEEEPASNSDTLVKSDLELIKDRLGHFSNYFIKYNDYDDSVTLGVKGKKWGYEAFRIYSDLICDNTPFIDSLNLPEKEKVYPCQDLIRDGLKTIFDREFHTGNLVAIMDERLIR